MSDAGTMTGGQDFIPDENIGEKPNPIESEVNENGGVEAQQEAFDIAAPTPADATGPGVPQEQQGSGPLGNPAAAPAGTTDAAAPKPLQDRTPDDDWSDHPTTSGHRADWSYGDPTGFGEYAEQKLEEFGWGPEEMPALVALWNEASSHLTASHTGQIAWNPEATNMINGSSGIPGLLPDTVESLADPMRWDDPNYQIDTGLQYIQGKYESPSAALDHMIRNDWY